MNSNDLWIMRYYRSKTPIFEIFILRRLSVLQDCLDRFSKKLSVILEAQGVSRSISTSDLLWSKHARRLVAISCSVQACGQMRLQRNAEVYLLSVLTVVVLYASFCSVAGNDRDHTDISEDEAADLCQRVSEPF